MLQDLTKEEIATLESLVDEKIDYYQTMLKRVETRGVQEEIKVKLRHYLDIKSKFS